MAGGSIGPGQGARGAGDGAVRVMLNTILLGVGGALLLGGLLLALYANREQAKAIDAGEIREDIVGTIRDHGEWRRHGALTRAETRFRLGIALTAAGVMLQTIGSILSSR